jgi:hypothetical protein
MMDTNPEFVQIPDHDSDSDDDSEDHSDSNNDNDGSVSGNNQENGSGGASSSSNGTRVKKTGRPHLKDCDKLRVMYLFAETFRRDKTITSWRRASEIVAHQFSQEYGHNVGAASLRFIYNRLSKPVAEQEVRTRGGRKSKVTAEFKEQLIFLLADPDVPAEQKSIRKIGNLLPDCPVSRTTLRNLFKEVKKEQIVPKPPKPPRRRKPQSAVDLQVATSWTG